MSASSSTAVESKSLAQQYQKKTDRQHILDNPDTYIGSIEKVDCETYIYDDATKSIIQKNINMIPGLYKLFDEGVVNCRDHVVRMNQRISQNVPDSLPVTYIDIAIGEDNSITMINDGNGVDIEKHPEYNIWIPELIFGNLRTSTNYDKTEKKIVGGKNGFGFKLALIWSNWGRIETVDHIRKLKYIQEFKDNLSVIEPPKITKFTGKPYTKVTFKPDYARLGIDGLSQDLIALFKRRVYDIAAVTDKSIKVKWNSSILEVKNFQQYIDLYIGDKAQNPRVYESEGERWEYAVSLAPNDEFAQVSFVNGIFTSKGGKHVEYILNQIVRKLTAHIKTKKKIDVKPAAIKEQLMLFIRCDVENPAFDSQTKDFMNTPSSSFGSKCEVSDKFIEKIAKMGVMTAACALTEVKETKAAKKTDGAKTKTIRGIPKLLDANFAGTEKSSQCTIIFCEGDSAKAGIVSGLSTEDRNFIGVYPLKGKLNNVRGETTKKIAENKEITEIKQILGLAMGKKYSSPEEVSKHLRYGKVLFMTDQDLDGTHIKGLGINLFQSEWPTLSKISGFIGFMNTPILKARKGKQELVFYNQGEYDEWKENNDFKGWTIKYYKGLGTSTGKEFKEYFAQKKIVNFIENSEDDVNSIDLVFNNKRADDRKLWLANYDRKIYLDTSKLEVSYKDFVDKDMIHFSKYDCDRSIPNLMDGLKISLRKILYSAFKRKLNSEIKVAQFSGYVSEHSGYHHGEQSLNAAIVGMAQNFVGSNNINLFVPNGQFGTRLQGGKDSASERYIFTYLNKLTRLIFPESDDSILEYLDDDGLLVEPVFYAPIIPMILVNGTKGIGTGFSTDIMPFNPLDIIARLKEILQNGYSSISLTPYYNDFHGDIIKIQGEQDDFDKYLISGCYEILDSKRVRITELPVGTWTQNYREYLESLIDGPVVKKTSSTNIENSSENVEKGKKTVTKAPPPTFVKSYIDMSTDTNVDITITFAAGALDVLQQEKATYGKNGLEKLLKLYTTHTTSNMHLFDSKEKLKRYDTPEQIMNDYIVTRLELYNKRKEYQLDSLQKELKVLSNKARFIQENLDDIIDLRKKTKEQIKQLLTERKFDIIDSDDEFKYLVKMPMDSVTSENVAKIMNERDSKIYILEELKAKPITTIWLDELCLLEDEYKKWKSKDNKLDNSNDNDEEKASIKQKKVIKRIIKKQK